MNKAENRKPTYALTRSEQLFVNLLRHKKYKDSNGINKKLIRFKSKFISSHLEDFERKVEEIII